MSNPKTDPQGNGIHHVPERESQGRFQNEQRLLKPMPMPMQGERLWTAPKGQTDEKNHADSCKRFLERLEPVIQWIHSHFPF